MLVLRESWSCKRRLDFWGLDKNDQRKLIWLSVSNQKLTVSQVTDEINITTEVPIRTVRKMLRKIKLNVYIAEKEHRIR